jgi:hypothetical protein
LIPERFAGNKAELFSELTLKRVPFGEGISQVETAFAESSPLE